jgi:hypothetical protein
VEGSRCPIEGAAAYERVPKGTATCLRGAAAYERVPILEQGTAACFVAASCGSYLSCVTASFSLYDHGGLLNFLLLC